MKKIYYFYNGRSILNLILDSIKLKQNHEILYPEFTCDVLFQFKNRNYKYNFYQTNKDFTFNLSLLKRKISNRTKVIILINFFGIKQNTKEIYNYCKKKNIYLIIDDCHTYYNPELKLNYDCDFKFFSPGKLFPSLRYGGVLIIYNNKIKINKNFDICRNQFSKNKLKNLLKSTFLYQTIKNLNKRPKYEDPNYFKSKFDVKNCYLNKKDENKIKNLNYKKQKNISLQNHKFWKKISKKLNVHPIINFKSVKHGIPLYFVAKCKNKMQAKKIFEIGWKNKIEITSWPTLNKKMIKNKKVISYWSKLIFFPNIYKINFNKQKLSWKI